MVNKSLENLKQKANYRSCNNCRYQQGPLQTCEWLKHHDKVFSLCPEWEMKDLKDLYESIKNLE